LCICDGVGPVALAGVMGGLNSEIRDTTKAVLFEAAKFARDNIRHTSRALGKRTDASARYEKGTDEYTTVMAMKRALHLIEELGCGKVSKTHCDCNTGNSVEPVEMKVSVEKVNSVLGITVPGEDILRIMKNLQFDPSIDGDELTLHVPAYRADIENYPDISEEVIRMYGYDHIQPTLLKSASVTAGGLTVRQRGEMSLKRRLCAEGMYEAMHYSFFSPADLDLLMLPQDDPKRQAVRLMNPINEDLSIMRTTLVASMLHAIERNQKNNNLSGRLFEIANRFIPKSLPLTDYPDELSTLCAGVWGTEETFYTLKGIADVIAEHLQISFTYEPGSLPFLHPYQCADIFCDGEKVGYLGAVRYELMQELNCRFRPYVMELDLSLLEKYYGKAPRFTPIPKYAIEKRDLALVMDKEITCAQVEEVIRQACRKVTGTYLFDVYEGVPIPAGKKSMAFTVTFTPDEEEFTTEMIDGYVHKILKNLKKSLDIEMRA
ncbi:MAG TPA: phenylalanine--tRNA ligase subunit beta, partial [Lachnospiraceae bacterium]|nr:phenylalanine--tRNA ligase subunit beta [Lachnospiraceae bacterium]